MTNEEKAEKYLLEVVRPQRIEITPLNVNRELKNAFVAGIKELEKENKDLQHRLDVAQGFLDRDVEYIEMCKAVKENERLKKDCSMWESRAKGLLHKNEMVDVYSLQKENAELKAQNRKMMCCHNCKNFIDKSYCITPCNDHSKWEIAE